MIFYVHLVIMAAAVLLSPELRKPPEREHNSHSPFNDSPTDWLGPPGLVESLVDAVCSGRRAAVCPSTDDRLFRPRVSTSGYQVCPSDHVSRSNKPTDVSSSGPAIAHRLSNLRFLLPSLEALSK